MLGHEARATRHEYRCRCRRETGGSEARAVVSMDGVEYVRESIWERPEPGGRKPPITSRRREEDGEGDA